MLDTAITQAAGLQGLIGPNGAQLLAVVRHGDLKAELPLLWRLCGSLVDLGYSVTVLDATQSESEANPGLEQMLEYDLGTDPVRADGLNWVVIPAAEGVHSLCTLQPTKLRRIERLGQIFPSAGIVILYARAEIQVQLLGDSTISPLLAVSPAKSALLTSYLALKRLLIAGRLEPTILNMMIHETGVSKPSEGAVTSNLNECAQHFLGYDVKAITFDTSSSEANLNIATRQLAMRLLERALPLSRSVPWLHSTNTGHQTSWSAESH